jgi:acetylornithine deacetylase/succinyl-diaminopimelate desuccinylase-like protein
LESTEGTSCGHRRLEASLLADALSDHLAIVDDNTDIAISLLDQTLNVLRMTSRALLLASLIAAAPLAAQMPIPSTDARVKAAVDRLKTDNAWTINNQISICEIPAPSFKEQKRGIEYKRRLEALGLQNGRIDTAGNVIAERRGTGTGPTVVIAGHLDTVFPEGTDVRVKRDGTRLAGPGIGDDCRGLAVVLAVARAVQKAGIETVGTVYFIGNVGEEGQGNLRGVRNLFTNELKGKVDYFISVDGIGLDLTSRGVGSNRYRITYKGPGGHSYGAFGRVNPIHALGRAIAQIGDIQVPTSPRTTFSVGVIKGGTSVNSIPFEATAEIDMRSESAEELATLDAKVRKILIAALDAENARWGGGTGGKAKVTLQIDTIGLRPANSTQTDKSPIVATAIAAGKALGFTPPTHASSTDANLPMSLGIPAITMDGGGKGGDEHALTEWYDDTTPGWQGPQWALLLVTALAGVKASPVP